jgi:energy-coupling factor transporter ATP-binding protein EcfA2
VTTNTVSKWERRVQEPTPHYRGLLCEHLGRTARDLGLLVDESAATEPPATPDSALAALIDQVRLRRDQVERGAGPVALPPIDLRLAERPRAVSDVRWFLRPKDEPDEPIPADIPIEAVFEDHHRQLLILGEPGAGKTTLLTRLARTLQPSSDRISVEPVPVEFDLSLWASERRPLAEWMAVVIRDEYGPATRIGSEWIEQRRIIPLLDRLDEVPREHRESCVAAINAFHQAHPDMALIVCCRTDDYDALPSTLSLNCAIVILPLTRSDVESYLERTDDEALVEVRALVREDERLWELLTCPLFVSMLVPPYPGAAPARYPSGGTPAARRRGIVAEYVERLLQRPGTVGSRRSSTDAVRWLRWLAHAMTREKVFSVDRMQIDLLPTAAQRLVVALGPSAALVPVGTVAGMLIILTGSVLLGAMGTTYSFPVAAGIPGVHDLPVSLPDSLGPGILAGAGIGTIAAIVVGFFTYDSSIVPTRRLQWSWGTLRRRMAGVLSAVLGSLLLAASLASRFSGTAVMLVFALSTALLLKLLTSRAPSVARHDLWAHLPKLAAGLGLALAAVMASQAREGLLPAQIIYLGEGLVSSLGIGVLFGFDTPDYEHPPPPGEGIATSRRNGLVAAASVAVISGVLLGGFDGVAITQLQGPRSGAVAGLMDALAIGLIFGMAAGLYRGGGAYVRHGILRRLMLWSAVGPPDLVPFLDDACLLLLLRRRGGGYEFRHPLIRELFAESEAVPPSLHPLTRPGSEARPASPARGEPPLPPLAAWWRRSPRPTA